MYFKEQDMDINRNNYETFFLLYLDRELNPSEMSEVEKFVNDNADLQKEFSLLRQTVLMPADITFDQKELLYRKEEKRRVIPVYWARMAAAAVVLVLGSWLISSQMMKNHQNEMTASGIKNNMVPGKTNSSTETVKTSDHKSADAAVNDIQPSVQQNITAIKNQSVNEASKEKTGKKTNNDLSGKNNPLQTVVIAGSQDQQNIIEDQDAALSAMQKSSAQELQPANTLNDANPKQITAIPDSHSPALLIASVTAAENFQHVRDENAAFADNEDQSDNAISVVALNDKNKGITRLFQKLTKRAPVVENDRKVRVSVFQFSY